ncbi:hypothetical protein GWI33_019764 [Rhynchophorus ferrugineus]|uniref:Peptidase S1 domain-containing protein n=1 Tax=Rhynchophorus ferrugineus TaxID=354439 RepID=A0A834M6N6_RHYFE|nr:hypothetical protein GWI33_019764 [Rhynchophorus ferrugineus]
MRNQIVVILLLTALITNSLCQVCTDVKREQYPYQAFVAVGIICNGALISNQHVIIIASCALWPKDATVYLGFSNTGNLMSKIEGQHVIIEKSKEIIIHENFAKINPNRFSNNIAIVVLARPVTYNNLIQPIALNKDLFALNDINITSWPTIIGVNVKRCYGKIVDNSTCVKKIGPTFLPNEEFCVKRDKGLENIIFPFQTIATSNNKLIGLLSLTSLCLFNCPKYSAFLNIYHFVDWIQKNTEITSTQHADLRNISTKIEQCCANKITYEEGISKLRTLIEENNKQFKEEYQKNSVNNTNQLISMFNVKTNETQQDIMSVRTESRQCKANVDKLMKSIEDYPKNTHQKLQYLKGNLSQQWEEIYHNITFTNLESKKHFADIELKMQLFEVYQRDTDQKLEQINTNLGQLKHDIQDDVSLLKTETEKQTNLNKVYQKDMDQKFKYFNENISDIRNKMNVYAIHINMETDKLRNNLENQIKSVENYHKSADQKLQLMNDRLQQDRLVINTEIKDLKGNLTQQNSQYQGDMKLTQTALNELQTKIEKEMEIMKQSQGTVDQKLQYLSHGGQTNSGRELEIKMFEQYRSSVEKRIDSIENYQKNIDQKLDRMLKITHKLDEKTVKEDLVTINRKIIQDELKKETQYIINELSRINGTIQNILHNISKDLRYPELT